MSQIMRFPKSKSGFSQKLNQKKVSVMVELTVGVVCCFMKLLLESIDVDDDRAGDMWESSVGDGVASAVL